MQPESLNQELMDGEFRSEGDELFFYLASQRRAENSCNYLYLGVDVSECENPVVVG